MDEKSKTTLVQEKIKQMLQSRRRIMSKENTAQMQRLKSNIQPEDQLQSNPSQQDEKPRTSMRIRPQTSQRSKNEQTNSITTDSSGKNDIDPRTLINDAFERGFELTKYLGKRNLNPEECRGKLMQNGLFHTLLVSRLSKLSEDQYEAATEKEVMARLQRMGVMERQERSCQLIEQKISLLLDERLRSLTQG